MRINMKAIAINIKSKDEFMQDLNKEIEKVWSPLKCRWIGAFLFLYMAFWAGSFGYSFCQKKGFIYYLEHIKGFDEIWPLVVSAVCLCIWIGLFITYLKELNKIDSLKDVVDSYYESLELKERLKSVESFVNFEDLDEDLRFNYLTNGILYSINLSKSYYNWDIGKVNMNDSLLIFDFGEGRIYSKVQKESEGYGEEFGNLSGET